MKLHYSPGEKILLLFVLQGAFPGSGCQDWSFSFPQYITALKGSCVEIPCTFTRTKDSAKFSLIWYLFRRIGYPQAFNNNNPSAVLPQYRGRTSLVGTITNSCSLRIDDVRSDSEKYYPGINKEINSFKLNKGSVLIQVTDAPDEPLLTGTWDLTEGNTINITCSVNHTCASDPPSVQWNKAGHRISVRHEDLTGGHWRVISQIQYCPSSQDDKTQLECTAAYPNGQKTHKGATLSVKSRMYINVAVSVVSGIVGPVLLLLIIYLCWRKRKSCWVSGDGNNIREERFPPKDEPSPEGLYMDLMKRDPSEYDELKI
ncbi:myelin-associated glycoprotein-like isoform X2 [Ascaphus truei]|uniref:myelin-associated glycoprotein-like isoform X2 n=1 Tax=Ascaphus truei TaxID=8439 RepID=UPI003F5A9DFC